MSSEIDIEEHDLMENPRIRKIFPDLSLLKQEVLGTDQELQQQVTIDNGKRKSLVSNTNNSIPNKRAMIGSKNELQMSKKTPLSANVIIFGSKPSKTINKKLKSEVKIYLKDINSFLKKNKCYCWICKTLFPKEMNLKEHNMCNDKEPLDKNGTFNQKKMKDSKINFHEGNAINKCFHCRKTFPTQDLLIEHLYEVLDKKKAITPKVILDKDYKIKSNNDQNSKRVPIISETILKSIDKAKFVTKSVDANCFETISIDSRDCEAISIEEDSSDNEIEVSYDTSTKEAFQCSICSYYFKHQRFLEAHMVKKHRTKVKNTNVVKFNAKCTFCSCLYPGIKQYNKHLHHAHSSMINNTNLKEFEVTTQVSETHQSPELNRNDSLAIQERNKTPNSFESSYDSINNSPILFTSVLFKCLKCDIHFLSLKLANSHIIHNEILINWKCPLCKIFFKRCDEDLHMSQHKHTKAFTVVNLDATDLNRIMIKCTKCLLHIPKNYIRGHLNICNEKIQNSWHCSVCDINIIGNIINKREHNNIHSGKENKKNDFIIINGSIMDTYTYAREVEDSQSEDIILSSVESPDTDNGDYSPDESDSHSPICYAVGKRNNRSAVKRNSMVKKKSKSTVKDKTKDTHKKSIANNKLITKNKQKRKRRKGIFNEISILRQQLYYSCSGNDASYSKFKFNAHHQPIFLLNLTYCQYCECFINLHYGLDTHLKKECKNLPKRVCKLCGLILTPKVIVRHKEFHKLNHNLKLQDFKFYDIETAKQIIPPLPRYPKCDNCDTHFLNKMEVQRHVCRELSYLYCDICGKKFSEETLNLHIPFHGYYIESESPLEHFDRKSLNRVVSNDNDTLTSDTLQTSQSELLEKRQNVLVECNDIKNKGMDVDEQHTNANEEKNDNNQIKNVDAKFLHTCETCNVTVSSYDQLIEHCHSHYNNSYREIPTEECTQCNLTFERSSISVHKELHSNGVSKDSFKVLFCDLFHFGQSNADWQSRVFKTLSVADIKEIIKDSIYKHEYRIKLEIIQQGDPELTQYQCEKCSIFIEGPDINTHSAMCTGGNKKYVCDYCGIYLASTGNRARHVTLHERPGLNITCYRIVVFNRAKDKTLNETMCNSSNQYIIYKCRNCHGVVEWQSIKSHQCSINDLKKCTNCGLLISNKDYDKHELKHNTSDTFVARNMKVVMVGQISSDSRDRNDKVCSFSGIAYDYTFYKCIKCNVCIQHLRLSSKHFCLIDAAKWKCSSCNLFFDEGKKRSHLSIHGSDMDFRNETICVIPFDPQETYERLERELKSKGSNDPEKDSEESFVSIKEKTDVLYRCSCDLHYLSEQNAREHVNKKKCGIISKKSLKQTCSKCNLSFTPEILYKHLLQHHADKYVRYTFDIVIVNTEPLNVDEGATTDAAT